MNRQEIIAEIERLEEIQRLEIEIEKRKFFKEFFPDVKVPDIKIKVEDVNPIYHHVLNSEARVIISFGGRDSGKSFFTGGQYIPLCMSAEKYFRAVAVRKTYTSSKDSTFTEIRDGIEALGIQEDFSIIKSPLEITHKNGNKIIFRGMDKPTNLKSLKGINMFWYEEAEDLTERQFDDLLILLRGDGYQRAILTFNPVDEDHFTNERFVLCRKDRVLETFEDGDPKVWEIDVQEIIDKELVKYTVLVMRSTFDDNNFIPAVRKLIIEKLKETDPFLYNVYRKGLFATRAGKILTNYEEVDFDSKEWNFRNFDNKGYVQDFGFNHANCILSVAEKDDCLYIFSEIYVHEKDTLEIIDLANKDRLDKKLKMICDSADPGAIKLWVKGGYRKATKVYKYPGSVQDQITTAKNYVKIYIDSRCINTLKEAKSWCYKQDKHGKFTDDPVDVFDDAMACIRYSRDLFSRRTGGLAWNKIKK